MNSTLPSPDKLAALVSDVTKTMLGFSFAPDRTAEAAPPLTWRMAVLPIPGKRPITVGLSSSPEGCAALGAALFSCPPQQVDQEMINDSLKELLNMTAGLLKSLLLLDQALGLPRILRENEDAAVFHDSHAVVLKAEECGGLVLWVLEGRA